MDTAQGVQAISKITSSLVFLALFWLHLDALAVRLETKTILRALGWLSLAASLSLSLVWIFSNLPFDPSKLIFWLTSLGFWLLYVSFIFDSHSKLQFLAVLAIASLFFFDNHTLLAIQAFLIAITILQISYNTKHKDLIPQVTAFILLAIGEFFHSLASSPSSGLFGNFMYVFAAIIFAYWLWQYLVIRFNLERIKIRVPKT